MASDVRLIISGTNYYFASGKGAVWTGSGTPWTAQNTTPFELANNPVTGEAWTPTADVPTRAYAPAMNGGGALAVSTIAYDVVTESIPIQIRGSTPANRTLALRALRRALDEGLRRRAVVLVVEPNDFAGTMSPVYYEVLHGDVQVLGTSTFGSEAQRSSTDSRTLLRARLTLVRRPYGGILVGTDSPETLINAGSVTNTAGSNTISMSPTRGDLINAGQPINLSVAPVIAATANRVYLASIAATEVDSSGWVGTALGGSYASMGVATFSGTNLAALVTQYPVAARLFVRLASIGASMTLRINLNLAGGSTYHTIDFSDIAIGASATGRLVDCGDIPIPIIPVINTTITNPDLRVDVQGAGSGTTTVGYVEIIFYYTFCVIPNVGATGSLPLILTSFPNNDARVMLPFEQPLAVLNDPTAGARKPLIIQGTAPRAVSGGRLWVAGTTDDQWAGTQSTSHVYALTCHGAPLYVNGLRAD